MKCASCGFENKADDRFCEQCGAALVKKPKLWVWIVPPIVFALAVIAVIVIVVCGGGHNHEESRHPSTSSATQVTTTVTNPATTMQTTAPTTKSPTTKAPTTAATTAPTSPPKTPLTLDSQGRYDINIFLSNFSEQHFAESVSFDAANADTAALVDFAYLFNYINRYSALHENSFVQNDISYVYLTIDEINRDLERFFGLSVTASAVQAAITDTTYHFVSGDRVCWAQAAGASHGSFTIVDAMYKCPDGTYEVEFTIYDFTDMGGGNHITDESVYYMTAAEALRLANVEVYASGRAVVRAANGDSPYHLIAYDVN